MTTQSPMLVAIIALMLAEAVGAMGELPPAPAPDPSAGAARAAFTCALVARSEGRSTVLEGRLEARGPIDASYVLRIRGPGISIDQSGEQSVGPGQSVILGEAQVTGAISDLDARLSVTAAGHSVDCPLRPS